MKCAEVNELIQRDIDQDLDSSEIARMQTHLELCADCRSFYDRIKRVHLDLESLPKVSLPYSIVDSILPELDLIDLKEKENIEKREKDAFWRKKRVWFRTLGTVAACILLTFIFMKVKDQNTEWSEKDRYAVENELMIANQWVKGESANQDTMTNDADRPQISLSVSDPNQPVSNESEQEKTLVDNPSTSEKESSDRQPVQNEKGKAGASGSQAGFNPATTTPPNTEKKGTEENSPPIGEDNGPMYGITAEKPETDDVTVTRNPDPVNHAGESTTQQEGQTDQITKVMAPDQAHAAIYDQQQLEIKDSTDNVLFSIQAKEQEYFSDIRWIDDSSLEYTINTAKGKEIWVYNINTGESKLLEEK